MRDNNKRKVISVLSAIVPVRDTPSEWEMYDKLRAQLLYLGADEVIVDSEPGGCAMARNRASRKANGDIYLFIDADTWPNAPKGAYAKVLGTMDCDFWQPRTWVNKTASKYTQLSAWVLSFMSRLEIPTPIVAVAIRRDIFEAIGRWDETVTYEDWEIGRVLGSRDCRMGYLPGTIEVHRKWIWHNASHASTRTHLKKYKYH